MIASVHYGPPSVHIKLINEILIYALHPEVFRHIFVRLESECSILYEFQFRCFIELFSNRMEA